MWVGGGGRLRGGVREAEAGQPRLGTGQACPDPLPGYLSQPGFLITSVVDSQQAGSIKYDSCPCLLVASDLSFLLQSAPMPKS